MKPRWKDAKTGRSAQRKEPHDLRKPAADHSIWIDLGCGTSKQPGFIGVDRFPLPGVDIVCDLNCGIPLRSDIVDYVLASHSLEHLQDLPAAIAEIYRVCKDRADVTIVAPYNATRLNQANPYHINVWNEHTARFFTTENASTINPAEYHFPAAEHWGLQASDSSRSHVELRCVKMEFSYLPPYRALDEETKRTLRHSLSDVCDQMVLHLLVVKSPITQEELSARAKMTRYPLPTALEARHREEADVRARNLFSELANTPARIAALTVGTDREIAQLGEEMRRLLQRIDHLDSALVAETAMTTNTNKEIALLGNEMRGLFQRIDHLDSALVAETAMTTNTNNEIALLGNEMRHLLQRADHLDSALVTEAEFARRALLELSAISRTLGERITAVNSALIRRMHVELLATTEQRLMQAKVTEKISHHFVAGQRARLEHAFRPLRMLRHYFRRGLDLRWAEGLTRLWQGLGTPQQAGFKLQPGTFLRAHVPRIYPFATTDSPLRSIEIGILALFPPFAPTTIADFELMDSAHRALRRGSVRIDASCASTPVSLCFDPVPCDPTQMLTLKLMPHACVEGIGVQPLEWHRITRIFRRVSALRLACRGRYSA